MTRDFDRMDPKAFRIDVDSMEECLVPMLRFAAERDMAFTPKHVKDTLNWLAADRIDYLETELEALREKIRNM